MNDQPISRQFQDEQDRLLGAKVLDKGRQALARQAVVLTPFLDPHQQRVAEMVLRSLTEVTHYSSGGYPGAERTRLAVMPSHFQREEPEMSLSFLRVIGDLKGEDISHRDVLGALLALGIKREGVGDILVTDEGAFVIATTEAAAYIAANLRQVRHLGVTVSVVEPREFTPPAARIKDIRGTVASLRLDAVASLGYSVSRTKMVSVIKAEQVKVNWQPVKNPAAVVKEGDMISISGRGRLEVAKVGGESRKGRLHLQLKKYL